MLKFRNIGFLLILVLAALVLTGCTAASRKSDYSEEEMPYGATMKKVNSFVLPIEYDRRYLNDEQLTVITNYLYSIQTKDAELYTASTIDFYADYQLNEVYHDTYKTMDELVGALHDVVSSSTGDDFSFTLLTVSDLTTETGASGLGSTIKLLENISPEKNFKDTIDKCWALEVNWLLSYQEGNSSAYSENNRIYLLEIGGKYYCMM